MQEPFVEMLRGDTNTLGRAIEVFDAVKQDPSRVQEVFDLYFQPDQWVRLRSSNVLRRLWREDPTWVEPFIARWIDEVSGIDQPSVQWTFAQIVHECSQFFDQGQMARSLQIVKGYLQNSDDWIVLNTSINTLAGAAKDDASLRAYLLPKLQKLSTHPKKSVASRAKKSLQMLRA